jgi:hypothetical protein
MDFFITRIYYNRPSYRTRRFPPTSTPRSNHTGRDVTRPDGTAVKFVCPPLLVPITSSHQIPLVLWSKFTQVAVVFSQRRSKKTWFSSTEEEIPFEAHIVTLREPPPDEPGGEKGCSPTRELEEALLKVLKFCAGMNRQIPPISSGTVSACFLWASTLLVA